MATRSHPESARIIREARQAAGLTQLELAEKLGVTIGTIGYYERGAGMFASSVPLVAESVDLVGELGEVLVGAALVVLDDS